ncbi:hypothetical protein SAMN05444003_2771 [Cognatiyoonia sediminum]|uniref:Uncharacterized protein n=1 Tax=Cognatiyoonia sediminum TaxID=1508389 RepID=A0A1M5RYQ9_9RHOB|nr:hypothetical protein [Cognatiyoonia sediminum]SHH31497.1 hypothetical protein SAMN05444003_2771 [Cognatiyoonia sediminum]
MTLVLLLGSGPNVLTAKDWSDVPFNHIVAINNAWRVRPDWTHLVHPSDFPEDRMPPQMAPDQKVIQAIDYVPLQNQYGGFVYAGGTMAFTASYWALAALKPRAIAVLGCDMVYPKTERTHFYGKGTADPLREDKTLRSLEAKSARLLVKAAQQGCAMVNLSKEESRLVFPRTDVADVGALKPASFNEELVAAAEAEETRLDYYVPSGKYWKVEDRFDVDAIDALDALWLRSVRRP